MQEDKLVKKSAARKPSTGKSTSAKAAKVSKSGKATTTAIKSRKPTGEENEGDDDYVTVVTARKAVPKGREHVSGLFECGGSGDMELISRADLRKIRGDNFAYGLLTGVCVLGAAFLYIMRKQPTRYYCIGTIGG